MDLRLDDPSILAILAGTVDRSGWTNTPSTSSSGTVMPWGLDAIYDTGEASDSLGLAAPVRLFSVQVTGLSPGLATLTIEPDLKTGADFVTWQGGQGGDFSGASSQIEVLPEPATVGFVALGSLAALLRRRR